MDFGIPPSELEAILSAVEREHMNVPADESPMPAAASMDDPALPGPSTQADMISTSATNSTHVSTHFYFQYSKIQ